MDTTELLRRQIDELQIPAMPTQAQQDQIMKGRKGQADIDKGREQIKAMIEAHTEAVKQRSTLTTQLSTLEKEGRQQKKEDYQASPEAQRNKALMTLGPSALGYGGGLLAGMWEKGQQGNAEEARNVQRRVLAESAQPQAAKMDAAGKAGLIPYASKTARGLSRAAPFGAGAAFFGADAGMAHWMQQNAETQGEKDIYGVARNLFGGLAAGSGHAGISSVFNSKISPDADALAKIGAADPTPTAPPAPAAPAAPVQQAASFKSGAEARRYAAEKGVKLPSKLTAAEAITRAETLKAATDVAQEGSRAGKLISKAGKVGIPAAAGLMAYDAASSDAEAAGASPTEANTRGAAAGAVTGGATAGSAYGLSKLLSKVPTLGKALGIGGGMSMPLAAMDMGPDTPEAANAERQNIAQNWPRLASLMGIKDEMAQLPERNTGKIDPFATARALPEPTGGPMPGPNGEPAYPDPAWLAALEQQAALGAGPRLPPQPGPPMRRPQLPYGAMGFGGI